MILAHSKRLIAHLDMNSFFASVEQQACRAYRGRPLGVCAYLGKHSCIIAPSIEAKRYGIKVGTTINEAKRRVPGMIFVQVDPPKYRSVISGVFGILHELTDCVEHYSIDEAFLDLTGWYSDDLAVIEPFLKVKQRIRTEIGDWLKCSIGVAPTRILAKMASDHQKPDGFTMVSHASIHSFLADHKLTDICGIGEKNRRKLYRLGIFTILDFLNYSSENLIRLCGREIYFLQMGLQGFECSPIHSIPAEAPKSVGHSYCVPRTVNQQGNGLAVFMKLIEKAGRRMRDLKRQAGSVTVVCNSETASYRFGEPVSDSFSLMDAALNTLSQVWNGQDDVSFFAVTLHELSPLRSQGVLLTPQASQQDLQKKERLSQAMDRVRHRYGDESILFGPMSKLTHEAPDRIGFRKVDGIEIVNTLL